ncbi:Baculoviral IAP repeat-containing protein 3 [Mizuhopecten yessoensis]|uniref:Baculoviral IAP repeat-containing protein 3 n=1 Tax=Mizuhopecten yessoensis TaxID=6573 RepID=A0A210Q7I5_MIZYE|nr:Baculoviral IAP repeat-containing protein 3 [Mizuhopecten yessoensis]
MAKGYGKSRKYSKKRAKKNDSKKTFPLTSFKRDDELIGALFIKSVRLKSSFDSSTFRLKLEDLSTSGSLKAIYESLIVTKTYIDLEVYNSRVTLRKKQINALNRKHSFFTQASKYVQCPDSKGKYRFLDLTMLVPQGDSIVECIGIVKVNTELKRRIEEIFSYDFNSLDTSATRSSQTNLLQPIHTTISPGKENTLLTVQDDFEVVYVMKHRRTVSLRASRNGMPYSIYTPVRLKRSKQRTKQIQPLIDLLKTACEELKDESLFVSNGFHRQTELFSESDIKDLSGPIPLDSTQVYPSTNSARESEQQRQRSFVFWPLSSSATIQSLVESGFYASDHELEIVECFSCGLSLRASELNGRHPLDVHREMSQHCQFLQSESIRERTFNNNPPQRFEPLTMNSISRDQNSQYSSSISNTNDEIDCVKTESDISYRQNTIESHLGEVAEKFQTSLRFNPRVQSHISQPSDVVEDGTESQTNLDGKLLLSGTNQNPRDLTDLYYQYSPRRDTLVSQQDNVNNGGHIHEPIEGATAAISNVGPSPSSLAQDSSTPPPRNPRYEQDNARRESFNAWNGRHDIDSLVEAGLFYTGDQDIVRCFHCDIGLAEWNREDDPWLEHARHSHECHFLLRIKGHAYVNDVQREWSKVYSPKRPDLSHVDSRLDTFHNWPRDFVVQTPEQLAIAGFYYAGMTDTARCHYCDGGLREWEPGDIPWVEHAKWFPHCKFVLKIKGLPFIQQCVARRNEVLEDPVPNNTRAENEALNRLRAPISNEEKNRAREENNPLYTAAAQSIIAMGYTTAVVTKCINAYIASTGQRNFGATDLMDIILDKEDEGGKLSSDGETEGKETNDDEFRYDGPALRCDRMSSEYDVPYDPLLRDVFLH